MDALSERYLGHTPIPIKELIGSGKSQITFNQVTAMLMGYRAYLFAYAMLGGLFILAKGMHLTEKPLGQNLAEVVDE